MDPQFFNATRFADTLYAKMIRVNPGIADLDMYEFIYALNNLAPASGWQSVELPPVETIENLIQPLSFFDSIQLKPVQAGKIVLDPTIIHLTRMLFAGLAAGTYPVEWVNRQFYFDLRGFIFFVRTDYFTPTVMNHFGGSPEFQFKPAQKVFDRALEINYREFRNANLQVDRVFLDCVRKILSLRRPPLLLTLVGPTAAGKTEIVSHLSCELKKQDHSISHIEMDHFLKDREFRDGKGMNCETLHFELFKKAMTELMQGHTAVIPRYDFLNSTSSHDNESRLRPGKDLLEIKPADLLLLEGNFPFHLPEISSLIGLKIVYLTDDPVRLKRKWLRDIDLRKKYDPFYFCNRYFKTQRQRRDEIYQPLMETADMVVDTTGATVWITPELKHELSLLPYDTRG